MSRENRISGTSTFLTRLSAVKRHTLLSSVLVLLVISLICSVTSFRNVFANARSKKATAAAPRVPALVTQSGAPFINFAEAREINAHYAGNPSFAQGSASTVRPLALASSDFDSDGVPDLVAGYSTELGDAVTLLHGNVDSIFPNTPEARSRRQSGRFEDQPYLSNGDGFQAPVRPDFMTAGDFDGDGTADVLLASRDSNQLFMIAGDGAGAFTKTQWIDLPGRVTALESGDLNRADGVRDVVVAVSGNAGAKLLVFEGLTGALKQQPEVLTLDAPTTSIAIGQLDSDAFKDIVIAQGKQIAVIHGRDRMLWSAGANRATVPSPLIEKVGFGFRAKAVAVGDFTADQSADIAALGEDGNVYLLSAPSAKSGTGNALANWTNKKLATGPFSNASRLMAARVSSLPVESLILSDGSNNQLRFVADGSVNRDPQASKPGVPSVVSATVDLDGSAAAVTTARLNGDALNDLVVLRDGHFAPAILPTVANMTFTVTTTADSGAGSLRQAIIDANANLGADTIAFAIGSGPQTITLAQDLPAVTDPVTIDATTQPGFGGAPVITIDAAAATSGITFKVSGGTSTVRGFAIGNSILDAIQFILVGGDIAEGNYLGTDAAGSASVPNLTGLLLATSNNTAGGTTAAARNVFSGNTRDGVEISGNGATGNVVQGNYIGVSAAGTAALPNQRHGIFVNAKQNTIGGTAVGAGNVISGNVMNGIQVFNGPNTATIIQGNLIGTDASGTLPLGNQAEGILLFNASANLIGGAVVGAGNTIGGNVTTGITITQSSSQNNLLQGNTIGASGVGNGTKGLLVSDAINNIVGGEVTATINTISFNGDDGVAIIGASLGNAIRGNNIFSNGQLGIDLADNGVTANDAGDGDAGPDLQQNFPVLIKATGGATTIIQGTLNAQPNTQFNIDFFASPACDASGFGEGQTFLGTTTVTTNGSGNAAFTTTLNVVSSGFATATATDPNFNTSEFSACVPICTFSLSPTSQNFTSAGGSNSFGVTTAAPCPWTAVSNAAFITITSGSSGTGSGTVNYSVAANPSITPRSGTITVENQTFTVTQDGAPCTFQINPTSQSFTSAGGTGTVTVTAPTGCAWTAVSNDGFITVTSGASGDGNGSVGYSVAAKVDAGPRTGTITIAGQTFTVTQSGADCIFAIAPTGQNFPVGGGTGTVSVTAPGGCNWMAVSNDAFITVTSGASGSGNGTVGYSVDANPNPGSRTGTINIAGQTFTVTQGGSLSCVFDVAPLKQAYPASGGTGVVNVTAPFGCNWTAVSNDPSFITITSGASGSGNGSVTYSVAAKSNAGIRTGTMTVAGQTVTIPQAGTSCITSITPSNQSFLAAGGSGLINVSAPLGCAWTATSLDSFVTIISGASGTGTNKVKYSVGVNPNAGPRIGFIIVGSKVHTVTQAGVACTFSISPTSQSFVAGGGTGTVTVTAPTGCSWTAVSNDGFVTITAGASGSGNGVVNYSVAANLSASPRSGTMTIAGQTFTVNQDPAAGSCVFSISPTGAAFGSAGGSASVAVTATAGCMWTAVSNDSFITITAGSSGTGNGTVSYSVDPNLSTNTRMGTMTIAGQVFTVTQSGSCTFTISPSGRIFSAAGGSDSVGVTTQAGCNWTAVSNVGWITITSGSTGSGNGSVNYTVSTNTSGASRTGMITIAGQIHTVKQNK